ncbi:hypothetical protein [Vagococcus fluvialis]|uniref:Uncharacterized protein n=1 Tax=Vagococcus fluvialis TaxID=2738 RepID=A0A7X6I3X1_9ENTE|nr:hypothetical protein [Vagococcus fluvialis]NKC68981.1 hypothetical protein [Vagococcus fluvialis]
MKVLIGNEKVEKPIELILPMYVHHRYKLMWFDIDLTVERYESLKSNLNEFKTVVTLDYIVNNLSEDDRKIFELLTCIEPFNPREFDLFDRRPNENSIALKFISKGKGYDNTYINEKLSPMYPGKKSIPKKGYKSLLESLENGIEEVQKQVGCGELFLEDMLTIAYTE